MFESWMQSALELAEEAARHNEVPVGAVVVLDGEIIGRGYNSPIERCDPSAHAEIAALRDAARHQDNYRLPGATLVVTVEPCTMCAGALVHARIEQLVFGTREPRAGAVFSSAQVLDNPGLNHRVNVIEGVLADECGELMASFFKERRH
jgi:tRNA(adenine34) deaminase